MEERLCEYAELRLFIGFVHSAMKGARCRMGRRVVLLVHNHHRRNRRSRSRQNH